MGRPINKKYLKSSEDTAFLVQAKFDDGSVRYGTIEKQISTKSYVVRNGNDTVRARLSDKDSNSLETNEMIIEAVDAAENTFRVSKITSKKVVTFDNQVFEWGTDNASGNVLQIPTVPEDGSSVVTPSVNAPANMSPLARQPNTNFVWVNKSNPSTNSVVATNGEIEIALRIGRYANGTAITYDSGTSTYSWAMNQTQDWNWTYSAVLIDNLRGQSILDLYDLELKVEGGDVNLTFNLWEDVSGKLHFTDHSNNIDIIDNTTNDTKSLLQNIERLKFWSYLYLNQATNTSGSILGTFDFTFTATRKTGNYDPVVCTCKANITAT